MNSLYCAISTPIASTPPKEPSGWSCRELESPLRRTAGEREGPAPQGWEGGEVVCDRLGLGGGTHPGPLPRERAERE